jgi:biopolymer transport protein ExbD
MRADRSLEYSKVLDASDIASKAGVRVVGYISEQTPGTEEQSVEAKSKGGT